MAMSFGKYMTYRVINGIILLFLVVLVSSVLFTKLATIQLTAQVDSGVQQWVQEYVRHHHQQPSQQLINKQRQVLMQQYGLNKPYWERVWMYTKDTFFFSWGKSQYPLYGTRVVSEQIKGALARTILLFTTAEILVVLIGLALGLKSAQNPGSLLDRTISILAMVTTSLPMWWLGMVMILIFVVSLGLLPIKLYSQAFVSGWKATLEKMTLPIVTIVLNLFGGWAWTTRNIMIGTMQEDFVMVARAKGVPERKVIYGHALRAAAPPIITMIIFAMIGSMSGAIITEIVFNWPGMGLLFWDALSYDAVRTLMALNYMFAAMIVFSMVLADALYGYLDPRVRVGASARS